MKIKNLNEFNSINETRRLQDDKVYAPQTEMELINIVHTLFFDKFNGDDEFGEEVMRDIVFDLSGIKDATAATKMVVAKKTLDFADMKYIYFLGISKDEYEKNKTIFEPDEDGYWLDEDAAVFRVYTKGGWSNNEICVGIWLRWDYHVDSEEGVDEVWIDKAYFGDIQYGSKKPLPAETFKRLPCYDMLNQYAVDADLINNEDFYEKLMSEAEQRVYDYMDRYYDTDYPGYPG